MSEASKAVFLSYASQDAEAARRICEALRSGGVEVWFDVDGGLEHGDEWDAKIRRQIKDCVLFIPRFVPRMLVPPQVASHCGGFDCCSPDS